MEKIPVILYGCGVMGRRTAEALLSKESIVICGAIDVSKDLLGKDLGELFDPPKTLGIKIREDADMVLRENEPKAAILTTTSHLKEVEPQIAQCVKAGVNVVSTCEELSYPWQRNPDLAGELDELAKKNGVTVVGTGINPGFLMDTLPFVLTAPCLEVNAIAVTRMMDSSKRRIPFQRKVGTGLTRETFKEKIEKGIITGHVGLLESMHMIASGLHWTLDEAVELPPVPVFAQNELETAVGRVQEGDVVGLKSVAYGKKNGRNVITLEFVAHAQVNEEYDEIIVEGVPRIHQKILGGVHGDVGTVAVTINTVPRAVESSAGLKTMKD
jgi:4-hydroxy-tetrahydrodipicolinate reductase